MDNLSIRLRYSQIFYQVTYDFRRLSFRLLITKILRLLFKERSPESFGIQTKRPPESSDESTATLCLLILDQTDQGS